MVRCSFVSKSKSRIGDGGVEELEARGGRGSKRDSTSQDARIGQKSLRK